jgi:hypothetical protein
MFTGEIPMKKHILLFLAVFVCICGCAGKKTIRVYPEKLEGLTQLVLASETKTIVISDTSALKILGFTISSAKVKITSNVTYDFYLDFEKDGYRLTFSELGDTLLCEAPPIRAKKPVINSTDVSYPEKGLFNDGKAKAIERLEKLTDQFAGEGDSLLGEQALQDKCREMLTKYLADLCRKMNFTVRVIIINFRKVAA